MSTDANKRTSLRLANKPSTTNLVESESDKEAEINEIDLENNNTTNSSNSINVALRQKRKYIRRKPLNKIKQPKLTREELVNSAKVTSTQEDQRNSINKILIANNSTEPEMASNKQTEHTGVNLQNAIPGTGFFNMANILTDGTTMIQTARQKQQSIDVNKVKKLRKEAVEESDHELVSNSSCSDDYESETDSGSDMEQYNLEMDVDNTEQPRRKLSAVRLNKNGAENLEKNTPFASKVNKFKEKNEKSIRDANAKNKYVTQFNINFTEAGAQHSLEKMLSEAFNEYLEDEEKSNIEAILVKINKKTAISTDETNLLLQYETKLNKIALKQHSMIVEAEIYLSDNLFGSNTNAATHRISDYKSNKSMTKSEMADLERANSECKKEQLKQLRLLALNEIINNANMNGNDKSAAQILINTLNDTSQTFGLNEESGFDELVEKQLAAGLTKYKKWVIDEALKIDHFSLIQKKEINTIHSQLQENDTVDIDAINKIQTWVSKSTLDASSIEYYAKIKHLLIENRKYEEKYPSNKYSVTIKGKGINTFVNTFDARVKEIKRCTGIKQVLKAELLREPTPDEHLLSKEELFNKIKNNKTEKREIKITVRCYDDIILLMKPWPFDAFGKGIQPFVDPIETLPITFNDVPKHYTFKQNTANSNKIECEYGITRIERVYVRGDVTNPMNKLNALPITVKSYVDALTKGIELCSGFRLGETLVNYAKTCYTCGTLDHGRCPDDAETICKKCTSTLHTTDKCREKKDKYRCVNCYRNHRCDSEECELLRRKTYKLNDYPISILLGEGVISHIGKVLKDPECERNNSNGVDKEELAEMITTMIAENETVKELKERMTLNEQQMKEFRGELTTLTNYTQCIDNKVDTLVAANVKADQKSDLLAAMMQQMLVNQQQAQQATVQAQIPAPTTGRRRKKNMEC